MTTDLSLELEIGINFFMPKLGDLWSLEFSIPQASHRSLNRATELRGQTTHDWSSMSTKSDSF